MPNNTDIVDRSTGIKKQIEDLSKVDPEAEEYYEDGSLRDTSPLSASERKSAKHIMWAVDAQMKQCYYNAQLATIVDGDTFQYVEGYVDIPELHVPVKHAWIEINGKVAEITFPDTRPTHPPGSVYFGVEYSSETVEQVVSRRDRVYPIAASHR